MTSSIEAIASICHDANRRHCITIGDTSQPTWEDAPDWQRQSAMNGVRFHMANPGAGPSGSHENWMNEKLDAGWRYGPVKDPEKKTHPCLMPYGDLPVEQRLKDSIFVAIVHALMDKAAVN